MAIRLLPASQRHPVVHGNLVYSTLFERITCLAYTVKNDVILELRLFPQLCTIEMMGSGRDPREGISFYIGVIFIMVVFYDSLNIQPLELQQLYNEDCCVTSAEMLQYMNNEQQIRPIIAEWLRPRSG